MRTRVGRRIAAAAAAVLLGAGLVACDSTVSGAAQAGEDQYEFAAEQAFEKALSNLAARPLMRYTTVVSESEGEKVSVAVARTGSAYGTSTVNGNKMTIAAVDGRLYVKTGKDMWSRLGAKANEVKAFSGKFALLEPRDIGFDPGAQLTPDKVAELLRQARLDGPSAGSAPETPTSAPDDGSPEPGLSRGGVEKVTLDDGTEVYRIPLGQYTADVTAEEPYRVVSTDVPLGGETGQPLIPEGAPTTFGDDGEEALRSLYKSLKKAVSAFKGVGVLVPDFRLKQGEGDLDCAVGGSCRASVKVSNSYRPDDSRPVSKFAVRMEVDMKATGLGSRSCTDTGSMSPGDDVTMSCTADFNLAPSATPKSYPVRAQWLITATARYAPNRKDLTSELNKELEELASEI